MAELIDVIRVGNTLGEGVAWDCVHECLWWTDIQERKLYRYDPVGGSLKNYALPERLASFGFVDEQRTADRRVRIRICPI